MLRTALAFALIGSTSLLVACEDKKTEAPPAAPAATPTPPPSVAPAPVAPAPGGGVGTIKGSVAFTGKAPAETFLNRSADAFCAKTKMKDEQIIVNSNATLKNVLVRVTNITGNFDPPKEPATVTQDNCMYRPRVQGVVAGQAVMVKNGDQVLHNVHTYKGTTTLFNQAQVAGSAPIEKKFSDQNAMLKFKCDVHPWMAGYVSVTNHPFFAVTGDDGAFEIKNVPAGTYKFEAWHEKFGTKTIDVTVAANGTADAKFSYDGTEK
jgi:plastocyanin